MIEFVESKDTLSSTFVLISFILPRKISHFDYWSWFLLSQDTLKWNIRTSDHETRIRFDMTQNELPMKRKKTTSIIFEEYNRIPVARDKETSYLTKHFSEITVMVHNNFLITSNLLK